MLIVNSGLCIAAALATVMSVSTAWAELVPSPYHGGMLVESGSSPGPVQSGPGPGVMPWPGSPHPPVPNPARAAPGPIAGAGLPVIVIGGLAYWAYRRSRRRVERS